jgi:hypothetical protein
MCRTEFFISPHHIAECVAHSWVFIVQLYERIYETSGARSLHLEILLGASTVISPRRVSAFIDLWLIARPISD